MSDSTLLLNTDGKPLETILSSKELEARKIVAEKFLEQIITDDHTFKGWLSWTNDWIDSRRYLAFEFWEEHFKETGITEFITMRDNFNRNIKAREEGEATEEIVRYILKNYVIKSTKVDKQNEIWIYNNGIYVPNGRSEIKEITRKILLESYSIFYANIILNKIEADTFIEPAEFFNSEIVDEVAVENGILNVITRELLPFTKDKIFFSKLNVNYNPEIECPNVDSFLGDVLADKSDRDVFYEMGGFALYKEYRFEKAFMLVGNGRNGKDKTLELIKRLIGVNNCCSVPLNSLHPDSFVISEFFGKMMNVAGEISNNDLKDTAMFKALTGRSVVSASRKFMNAITFQNYAKFVFACNELPMVYDNSRGFWDRWVILKFPYTFVTQKELDTSKETGLKLRDECIIDKITTEDEMSGMLNMFLDGLERLIKNKTFSISKGTQEIKEFWIRKSNSVMAFCIDSIGEDYDSFITKKNFRKEYFKYCKIHKIKAKSDYVIKRTLEEMYGASEGNRQDENKQWTKSWECVRFK